MNIDTIYAAALCLGTVFIGIALYSAFNGERWAQIMCFIWIAMLEADRVWAVRETSALYAFLKGLLGGD